MPSLPEVAIISVAQGFLMGQQDVDPDQALAILEALAELRGWDLADLARSVVEHRALPLGDALP